MGRTTKPCPGCGDVCGGRKADEVCGQCKHDLYEAKQQAAYAAARAKLGESTYAIPWFWPHISIHAGGSSGHHLGDKLQKALLAVLLAGGQLDARGDDVPGHRTYSGHIHDNSIFPEGDARIRKSEGRRGSIFLKDVLATAIAALDQVIREVIEVVYQAGLEEGQDVIRGLASGEFTVEEFNRLALKGR